MRSLNHAFVIATIVLAVACERAKSPPTTTPPTGRDVAAASDAGVDAAVAVTADVVICVDMSKSMEEQDLPPDRLGATQLALRRFVDELDGDRVGLVIFAQKTKVVTPLTSARDEVSELVMGLRIGDVPELGTAMGDGLALAVEQLDGSTAKRRAIVLLADGDTNWVTKYDPQQAGELAKARGIPVHAIVVGREDIDAFGGMAVNPKPLQDIASATGGTFHRALDPASFDASLAAIRAKLRAQ